MKILEEFADKKFTRVMGVDASSRGIGICVVEGGRPTHVAKLRLSKGDILQRLGEIRKWFPGIITTYNPEFIMVEEPLYVQSALATKYISYVVGIIYAECVVRGVPVKDVQPMAWKSFLGVKAMTKNRKAEIIKNLGKKDGEKEIKRLKKSQTMDILKERYPQHDWEKDSDISDSAGIALFAWENFGHVREEGSIQGEE